LTSNKKVPKQVEKIWLRYLNVQICVFVCTLVNHIIYRNFLFYTSGTRLMLVNLG